MRLTAKVGGAAKSSDAAEVDLRATSLGSLAVSDVMARYAEAAKRGSLFFAQTAVTGVAPGTAIGTTAAFSLYNPGGNDKDLVVLWLGMGYVSGTFGAGVVSVCANTNVNAAATTGTAITVVPGRLGCQAGASGKPLTTATLPVNPTVMFPFCSLQASLASTAVAPWQIEREIDGSIIVSPGTTLSLEATAAIGSTPLVVYGCLWEEIPV